MAGNICGNCINFKPRSGEQFFNCTKAKHAGLSYGMQVRANTQACEAFALHSPPPAPRIPSAEKKATPTPGTTKPVRPTATSASARQPASATRRAPAEAQPTTGKPAEQGVETVGGAGEGRTVPMERPGLCPWGKGVLIMAVVFIIALVSGLVYLFAFSGSAPEPIPVQYQMGQIVETPHEIFNLISTERTDKYVRGDWFIIVGLYIEAEPGTDFVIVEATVTNVGDSTLSVSPDDFRLRDPAGREYKLAKYQGFDPFPKKNLAPLETIYGKVLFVVPEVISGLELTRIMPGAGDEQPILGVWKLGF